MKASLPSTRVHTLRSGRAQSTPASVVTDAKRRLADALPQTLGVPPTVQALSDGRIQISGSALCGLSTSHDIDEITAWVKRVAANHGWTVDGRLGTCPNYLWFRLAEKVPAALRVHPKLLWHVTPTMSTASIARRGLMPAISGRGAMLYEHRVYCLRKYNLPQIRRLFNRIQDHDEPSRRRKARAMAIFEIGCSKCPRTEWFVDQNAQDGVWTTNWIPPRALRLVYRN